MRRGRFVESYGPSIAAGEAIDARRPARPGLWLLGQRRQRGRRRRASTSARWSSSIAAWRRSPATVCRASRSTAGRASFVLRGLGAARGGRTPRPRRSRRWPSSSASRSWSRWPATTAGWSRSRQGEYELAAALLARVARRGRADQPAARRAWRWPRRWPAAGIRDEAAEQVRATVLEPVRPSDFPDDARAQARARPGADRARARETVKTPSGGSRSRSPGWERAARRGASAPRASRPCSPTSAARWSAWSSPSASSRGPAPTCKPYGHEKEQPDAVVP